MGATLSKTYDLAPVTARYVLLDVSAVHGGGDTYGHAVHGFQVFTAAT